MKRVAKGNFGYTISHRRWQIAKASCYVLMALAIFLTGWITTKTTKNLLTIVAVVGALPIAKEMVGVIMSFKRKPMEPEKYKEISKRAGNLEQAYELLFTTSEKSFPIEAAVIEGKDVICYSRDLQCETSKLQLHLKNILEANGYHENVKIYTNYKTFLEKISELERRIREDLPYEVHPVYPELNRNQLIRRLLLAVSV